MALTRITQETDTGGGAANKSNTNFFKYTTPSTNKTTKSNTTKTTTPTKTSTKTATKTSTKTVSTTTPKSTKNYSNKRYYTYNTPTYNTTPGTSSAAAAEPAVDNASKNWNNYLKLLNETYTNEAKTLADNAANYATATGQNIAQSETQYNNAYNANKSAIANLEAQNRQREAAINQSISDYYKNLVDSYNRSMGYVDQGFAEGNDATARARDEAIELAAQLYAMGEETQNQRTEKDLKGQYISYMNGLKNMNQRLSALGINGGAAETTLLGALNGYEANRTDLEEARASALGQLRQQQMQSDSEAQQAYLSKLADLISARTTQQLGVENTRSTNEGNYANMQQQAQNNFQNWASDLTGKKTSNESAYADAIRQLAEMKNTSAYNSATLSNQAAQSKSDNYSSTGYTAALEALGEKNAKAKVKKTEKQKEKDKKKKEKEKKKKEEEKKKKKK